MAVQYNRAVISKTGILDKAVINFTTGINVIKDISGFVSAALVDCLWRPKQLELITEEDLREVDVEIDLSLNDQSTYKVTQKNGEFSIYANTGIREFCRYGVGLEYICEKEIEKIPAPLSSFLKSIDAKNFISSSYLPKTNLNAIDFEALKDLVVDDGSGYFEIYNYLDETFLKDAENRKVIKSINELEKNIKDLSKKNEIFKIKSERYSKLKNEEVLINKDIIQFEKDLSKLKKNEVNLNNILQKVKKHSLVSQEINEITTLLNENKSRQEKIKLLESEIEENYKKFIDYGMIEDDSIVKLQNLFDEYRKVHYEIEKIYDKSFKIKTYIKYMIGFLFIASWASASVLFVTEMVPLAISASIGLAPILIMLPIILMSNKPRNNADLDEHFSQKARIKSELEKLLMIENIAEYDCHFEGLFQLLMRHFDDFLEYSEKKNEIEGIAADMNSVEDIDKFKKKLNQLKKKRKDLKQLILAELSKSFPAGLNDFDESLMTKLINRNDEEIKSLTENISEKKQIISNIISEMKNERDYSQEIEAVNSEIADAENKLQVLTKKKNAIYAVIESLSDAVKNIGVKKYNQMLTESLDCFHSLTNGVYDQIDEKTIDTLIKTQDEYNELSDEVKYCILLSAKLRLSNFLLNSGKNIPLIIEESTDAFSIINGDFLKSEIDAISKERQVIVFVNETNIFESENVVTIE